MCAISPLASFHVTASITLERESGKCNKRVWERNKSEGINLLSSHRTSELHSSIKIDELRGIFSFFLPLACVTLFIIKIYWHIANFFILSRWTRRGTWLGKKGANINKENDPESEDGCEMEIKKGQFNGFFFIFAAAFFGPFRIFFIKRIFVSLFFQVTNFCSSWVGRKLQ